MTGGVNDNSGIQHAFQHLLLETRDFLWFGRLSPFSNDANGRSQESNRRLQVSIFLDGNVITIGIFIMEDEIASELFFDQSLQLVD